MRRTDDETMSGERARFEGMIEAKLQAMHEDIIEMKGVVRRNSEDIGSLKTAVAVLNQRVANELSHIRRRATMLGTVAAAVVSAIVACLRWFIGGEGR